MASSGSFNLIELTAKSQNNEEYGIFYTGDLTIKDSTVNASSLSAGTLKIEGSSVTAARDLYANASTGTSSISQSRVIAYKSANLFNLLEIKDNAAFTGGQIDCSNGLTQSSGLVSTLNGAVTLNQGNYDGSGGSLTAQTDIKVAKGDMTLKGTAVRASNGKVYVGRDLKASGGSLTVGKGGIYVGGDLRLSGSGFIETTAEEDNTGVYKPALKTVGKFVVDGGTLRAFQNGTEGNAISVSDEADVNGGTITAEINNSDKDHTVVADFQEDEIRRHNLSKFHTSKQQCCFECIRRNRLRRICIRFIYTQQRYGYSHFKKQSFHKSRKTADAGWKTGYGQRLQYKHCLFFKSCVYSRRYLDLHTG